MSKDKKDIYSEEAKALQAAQDLLSSQNLTETEWKQAYAALSLQYASLLENIRLITTISDRFQQKLKLANERLEKQSEEISRINLGLDADNRTLKGNLSQLVRERVNAQVISFQDFKLAYPTDDSCLAFLAELKWSNGYTCKKCGNQKHCSGQAKHGRRCTRCRYDESPTVHTLFHKVKFGLPKGFYCTLLLVYIWKKSHNLLLIFCSNYNFVTGL